MLPRARASARERGYTREWDRISAQYKWRNPFCLGCLAIGLKRAATVVDHVVPHRGDRMKFWDEGNWQSCCAWHHNSIKPELERLYARGAIGAEELRLTSMRATKLTRERYKPPTGIDGYPIREEFTCR